MAVPVPREAVRRAGTVGSSLGIRIPRGWGIRDGDYVMLRWDGRRIVIEPTTGAER